MYDGWVGLTVATRLARGSARWAAAAAAGGEVRRLTYCSYISWPSLWLRAHALTARRFCPANVSTARGPALPNPRGSRVHFFGDSYVTPYWYTYRTPRSGQKQKRCPAEVPAIPVPRVFRMGREATHRVQCAVDTNPVAFSYRKAWTITCGRDAAVYCTHGQIAGTGRKQVVYQDSYVKCGAGIKRGKGKDASMRGVRAFNARENRRVWTTSRNKS